MVQIFINGRLVKGRNCVFHVAMEKRINIDSKYSVVKELRLKMFRQDPAMSAQRD